MHDDKSIYKAERIDQSETGTPDSLAPLDNIMAASDEHLQELCKNDE